MQFTSQAASSAQMLGEGEGWASTAAAASLLLIASGDGIADKVEFMFWLLDRCRFVKAVIQRFASRPFPCFSPIVAFFLSISHVAVMVASSTAGLRLGSQVSAADCIWVIAVKQHATLLRLLDMLSIG